MQSRIVEVTNGWNHGKFLVSIFDVKELAARSQLGDHHLLIIPRWGAEHVHVLDLETGEGSLFRPGGMVAADLNKHRVWVCPMYEPFLGWLYEFWGTYHNPWMALDHLPTLVNLTEEEAPSSLYGYRRPGTEGGDSQE